MTCVNGVSKSTFGTQNIQPMQKTKIAETPKENLKENKKLSPKACKILIGVSSFVAGFVCCGLIIKAGLSKSRNNIRQRLQEILQTLNSNWGGKQ